MLASLHGLCLASSVLPVLTITKSEEMRKDAGITLCGMLIMKYNFSYMTIKAMLKKLVFTHLLVLGTSDLLLFGVKIISECPLAVRVLWTFVCSVSDLLLES